MAEDAAPAPGDEEKDEPSAEKEENGAKAPIFVDAVAGGADTTPPSLVTWFVIVFGVIGGSVVGCGGLFFLARTLSGMRGGELHELSRTGEQMRELEAGLREYYRRHGSYPEGDSPELTRELVFPETGQPLVEPRQFGLSDDGRLLDTWGHPYVYRSDGTTCLLYSRGPDEADDGGADDDIVLRGDETGNLGMAPPD